MSTNKVLFLCERKPSEVVAYQATQPEVVTIQSGERMNAKIGDWIVERCGVRWVCEHEYFFSLYEIVEPVNQ